jgi:hypothetical protein
VGNGAKVSDHLVDRASFNRLTYSSVSTIGLINGGTAGLIWIFFICWIGFLLINTSMAEMGSM